MQYACRWDNQEKKQSSQTGRAVETAELIDSKKRFYYREGEMSAVLMSLYGVMFNLLCDKLSLIISVYMTIL